MNWLRLSPTAVCFILAGMGSILSDVAPGGRWTLAIASLALILVGYYSGHIVIASERHDAYRSGYDDGIRAATEESIQ